MKILRVALLALLPGYAAAAPFIGCDLVASVSHTAMQYCQSINLGTCTSWGPWLADTPAVVTGGVNGCRNDAAAATIGANMVRVKAVLIDPVWGRQESAPSAPFAFSRPATPATPSSLRLDP